MPYDPERDGPLRGGASNEGDEYLYGISPMQAAKLADDVLADERRYGSAPRSDGPKPGPRRNRHLNGDGYGEGR